MSTVFTSLIKLGMEILVSGTNVKGEVNSELYWAGLYVSGIKLLKLVRRPVNAGLENREFYISEGNTRNVTFGRFIVI